MSNKTIAKFASLVILVTGACGFATSCSHPLPNSRYKVNAADLSPDYDSPVVSGRIESPDITESSGLAASLCQSGVYWTLNDSGGDAFIYAISTNGKSLGTWRVMNAKNVDWEDMAAYKAGDGTCYLYLGDIGNNKLERPELRIYRVKEPKLPNDGSVSNKKSPLLTEPADAVTFKYADTPHNAETLMVQPKTGDIYVLTKRLDGPSLVFKLTSQFGSEQTVVAAKIGEVSVPSVPNGLLTGGAISPDAGRVILCDYSSGYELKLAATATFDEIWKSRPVPVNVGDRRQGEAVTFSPDGKEILATSEKKNAEIFEVRMK
jgi:WD40 repeat protein